jgi:hypothetical protein
MRCLKSTQQRHCEGDITKQSIEIQSFGLLHSVTNDMFEFSRSLRSLEMTVNYCVKGGNRGDWLRQPPLLPPHLLRFPRHVERSETSQILCHFPTV